MIIWHRYWWLGFFLALVGAGAVHAAPKRVLILHSFGRDFAPFDTMSSTFRTELARQSTEPVEFYEASIETARFSANGNDDQLMDYLRTLFAGRRLDLIFTVAEPATFFCVRHRADFFPDTPLLAHVDHRQIPLVLAATNATINPVYIKIPVLAENILRVLPNTTNIVMVLGASPFERVWTGLCRDAFAGFTNRVAFTYVNDLPMDKIRERVAALPPNSAILYAMLAMDAAGVPYEQEKALASLRAAANAPVFGVFESQMGQGIVGGPLLSLEDSARQAARAGLRLLRGEQPATIAIPPPAPTRFVFDWRELRLWNINAARLPANSVVRYRPPSQWVEHKGVILTACAVILAQTLTIAALLVHRARRRRSEEALHESEKRMSLAADAANLGLWVWDVARDEIWATAKCRALFGFTPDERLTFTAFAARVHPDDRAATEHAVQRALEKKAPYDVEYRLCLPGGGLRWIAARGVGAGNGTEQSPRMLGVCIDQTEKKKADTEIQRQRAELAHVARVSTMGELAASVAHELNQPLGAILRNAEAAEMLFDQKPLDEEEIRAILADIRQDDQRAGAVIDRMRALMKRRDLEFEKLSVSELVDQVAALTRAETQARQVTMTVELPPDLLPIRGDRVHLQQVLLNLILNGMDAMSDLPADRRRLEIRAQNVHRKSVEVAVRDSGSGIPPDKLGRVFEPFFSTKPSGMGMGLAISETIMIAHNGRIWAENHPDGGAAFRFAVPVA